MNKALSLMDIVSSVKHSLIDEFSGNLTSIILYGSFGYQELGMDVGEYQELVVPGNGDGKGPELDRKPDLIVVVPSLRRAIRSLGASNRWKEKDIERLVYMNDETPFFFNLRTQEEFEVNGQVLRLPYKIALTGDRNFFGTEAEERPYWKEVGKAFQSRGRFNTYLSARLTKFLNVLYCRDESSREMVRKTVRDARDLFVDLALQSLPRQFSYGQLIIRYLAMTYMHEAHRLPDLAFRRYRSLLDKQVYSIDDQAAYSMMQATWMIVQPRLLQHTEVQLPECSSGYNAGCEKPYGRSVAFFRDLLWYNIASISNVAFKNTVVNATAGGSNTRYLARKLFRPFWKMLSHAR